jgi:hypothetical protein
MIICELIVTVLLLVIVRNKKKCRPTVYRTEQQ